MSQDLVLINKVGFHEYPTKEYVFSPSQKYPEYIFGEISPVKNDTYATVRESFILMGYDKENYGMATWNPLKDFINPGDTVLIKPNLVSHENQNADHGMDCVITNPAIIRAVADYALLALGNSGRLIIGDAPLQSCDFEALLETQGLSKVEAFYGRQSMGTKIEVLDFRNYKSKEEGGVLVPLENETEKGICIDLAKESEFHGLPKERINNLRITNYPDDFIKRHHNENKHEYIISEKALAADVVINMPKPKTHRYAGVTLALKNMIGINANKECLPHHSVGSLGNNGDEYEGQDVLKELYSKLVDALNAHMRDAGSEMTKMLRRFEKELYKTMEAREGDFFGSWHKNDTIWRTILDVNKILFYADKKGKLQDTRQRKMLVIGDMIVSGHVRGPLAPTPKAVGAIIIGENPVSFDEAVCTYMGFDYLKIPTIRNAREIKGKYKLCGPGETVVVSNDSGLNNKSLKELDAGDMEQFIPHPCWEEYLTSQVVPSGL